MTTTQPTWCYTCGNPVENGNCACWCMVAGALQQYLGMDFDGSADLAARMWDETSDEDKTRVWSAEYANDHDVTVYPPPETAELAALRERDRRDFPHDEDCPRCGRRQWTDEAAPETCQACGYTFTE